MPDDSILDKAFIDQILSTAKHNLERDGRLYPVLFVKFGEGAIVPCSIELPATTEEKRAYLASVGWSMRCEGKVVREALLLAEGWFVKVRTGTIDLMMRPSQHPLRREAITIMGRDASGTHTSTVVQAFGRDSVDKPVWTEPVVASYNEPVGLGYQPVGLLDCLFDTAIDGR